jgi:hypothetical protein
MAIGNVAPGKPLWRTAVPTHGTPDEIRLKPDALDRMAAAAEAAGERIRPGHFGRPNASGLLGGLRDGRPTEMFGTEGYAPGNKGLALIARLHARRRGITWYEALGELCDGPAGDDERDASSDNAGRRVAA